MITTGEEDEWSSLDIKAYCSPLPPGKEQQKPWVAFNGRGGGGESRARFPLAEDRGGPAALPAVRCAAAGPFGRERRTERSSLIQPKQQQKNGDFSVTSSAGDLQAERTTRLPSTPLPLQHSWGGESAGGAPPAPSRPRARPGVRGGAACCPLPGGGRGIPLLPRGSRARFAACREGSVRRAPRRAAPSPLPPGGSGQGRRREHVSRPGATEAPSAALGSPRHGDRQRGVSMTRAEPSPAMPASPLPVSRGTYVGRRVAFSFPSPPSPHFLFFTPLPSRPARCGTEAGRGGRCRPGERTGPVCAGAFLKAEGRRGERGTQPGELGPAAAPAKRQGSGARAAFSSEGAASPRRAPGCGGSGPSLGPFVCPLQPRCGPWGHEEPQRACPCPARPLPAAAAGGGVRAQPRVAGAVQPRGPAGALLAAAEETCACRAG